MTPGRTAKVPSGEGRGDRGFYDGRVHDESV